jgi:hypothetical protein
MVAALASAGAMTLGGCSVPLLSSSTPVAAVPSSAPVKVTPRKPAKPPKVRRPPLPSSGAAPVVVPQLLTYAQWIVATGNAAAVAQVAAPGCPFENALSDIAQEEARSGLYVLPSRLTVMSVQVPAGQTGTEESVDVEVARDSEPRITAKGVQVGTASATLAPTRFEVTLDQGVDRRWRICSVTEGAQSDRLATDPAPLEETTDREQGLDIL